MQLCKNKKTTGIFKKTNIKMPQFCGKICTRKCPLHFLILHAFITYAGCTNYLSFWKRFQISDKIWKLVGLSRATFDSQVIVLHFDLTGLPIKCIQWVNNSTLSKSQSPNKYFVQGSYPNYWLQKLFWSKKFWVKIILVQQNVGFK